MKLMRVAAALNCAGRVPRELAAQPGTLRDRIEQAERQRADRILRRRACREPGGDMGNDMVGRCRRQLALVRNAPVDRAAAGREARRRRTEGEDALTLHIEDGDRGLDDALARRVKVVPDSYPESIARMKQGVADGSLEEETWPGIIAGYEEQLAAAREGRMKIAAETDPWLVQGRSDFTMRRDAIGFSGSGQRTTTSDWTALHAKYGANVEIGSSPYTPGWVITW